MNNVQYSFVSSDEGSLSFRSSVTSFGLDHVTDKDISSFYAAFSSYSYFDSGLLPVDGSGLLFYRSAGNHSQIAYQHKPGLYYINWGEYEGDRNAVKYYVAQPYRIVIADILDGNLLGARTFYSPIPITYPDAPLYHVNLPNINCKGYRGNGVGWICLYHTEDISQYPFNEKLARILDRCSGTEAYNDQNMSETDGPHFYRDHDKPSHLWDPQKWQDYSQEFGYDWTLDPDLWIPVLVSDIDDQGKHSADGQPLTVAHAILGNYQAYYTDSLIPKHVNKIARPDYSLQSSDVFNWFKQAYNSSTNTSPIINSLTSSQEVKEAQNLAQPSIFPDESNTWYCEDCEETFEESEQYPNTTWSSAFICDHCLSNYYIYCSNTKTSHHGEDSEVLYLETSDVWIYLPKSDSDSYKYCHSCGSGVYFEDEANWSKLIMSEQDSSYCVKCYSDDSSPF